MAALELEGPGAAALMWGPHFVSSPAETLSLQHYLCGQVRADCRQQPQVEYHLQKG